MDTICQGKLDIPSKLKKTFKCGSRGEVCVSEEKPAELLYNYSNNTLALKVHYTIKNQYGVF